MNMRKTALASAIALALAGSPVWAVTSTVDGQFILDKTEVSAGGKVNLALLGLNSGGEVDRFGEQSGAVIMAVVSSVQGEVIGGDTTPGESFNDVRPGGGAFAASVKYIRLIQGNGQVYIQYPVDASGTDTLTVTLQQRFANAQGGVEFKTIATATKTVKINPANTSPVMLRVTEFKAAPADPAGVSSKLPAASAGQPRLAVRAGISGAMQAGFAGGQIVVEAANPNAAGMVTITLTGKNSKQVYTYKDRMIQGKAIVTLDDKVQKTGGIEKTNPSYSLTPDMIADTYWIKAEVEGFTGNSVGLEFPDVVKVYPTGTPRKLALVSEKMRIPQAANLLSSGTMVKGYLLDEFGNLTTNRNGNEVKFNINDANGVISNNAIVLKVPAQSMTGETIPTSGDDNLGNVSGEIIKTGTASIVAAAVDANGIQIATIQPSDPLGISVVADSLGITVTPTFMNSIVSGAAGVLAGTEFDAFVVGVTDAAGTPKNVDPGAVTIKNLKSGEALTVNRKTDGSNIVQALFKKSSDGNWYLISDKLGSLAEVKVMVVPVKTAAATVVELRNAHNEKQGNIVAAGPTPLQQFVAGIPEVAFKMFDSFGNAVTVDTGQFTLISSKGNVSYDVQPAVPGRKSAGIGGMSAYANVTFDGTGTKKFAGDDPVAASFTKPGLGTNQLTITTTVPALQQLTSIKAYIEQTEIPTNSQVALTVEVLDQNGRTFIDPDPTKSTVIKVDFNGVTGDTLTPSLTTDGGVTKVTTGQSLNFTASGGRKVFIVDAGPVTGQFSLTFSDANGTVKDAKTFKVTPKLTTPPVTGDCSINNLGACDTEAKCTTVGGVFTPADNTTTPPKAASCKVPEFPALDADANGNNGFDKDGVAIRSVTLFTGGISLKGAAYVGNLTIKGGFKGNPVKIIGSIKVDPAHVGQLVDILAVAIYNDSDWYMMDGAIPKKWDLRGSPKEYLARLTSLEVVKSLPSTYIPLMYSGEFLAPGKLDIFFGYRLSNGTIVYTGKPIKVVIEP